MAKINFDHDFWDMLTVKKYLDFFNTLKVNSASDFNEYSMEETEQNVRRLGILKVIGKSMLGKLRPGAKVSFEIKNEILMIY